MTPKLLVSCRNIFGILLFAEACEIFSLFIGWCMVHSYKARKSVAQNRIASQQGEDFYRDSAGNKHHYVIKLIGTLELNKVNTVSQFE